MTFSHSGLSAKLTEYAYDTVPGQTIDAGQTSTVPEPGTLGLLALGAVGLFALRKRKLSAISHQPSAINQQLARLWSAVACYRFRKASLLAAEWGRTLPRASSRT